jgi:glycerol uptake facilitator-like aquaporin
VNATLGRRIAAEGLGTALLLAVVVGSGIMGQTLAPEQDALALLGNTLATGAALVVLITVFGPVSGAHFNPVVTTVMALRRQIEPNHAILYVTAQVLGALVGVALAHAMFGQAIVQVSTHARDGGAQVLSEAVATFGLMATILGVSRFRPEATAACVGLYITAAYWFTASTSFANPAVTLARGLTDTFSGIAPASIPGFVLGQIVGAVLALAVFDWMFKLEPAA